MKESIFTASLRSLFVTFAAVVGLFLALLVVILGLSALSGSIETPPKSDLMVSADANGHRKLLPSSTPVLLRIDVHGVIGEMDLTAGKFTSLLLDSRTGALDKDRVKGILLHLNTPGGLATDSSSIYHLLDEYKKKYNVPVYAFVDGMCASGGMYIACAADKIYSTGESVIGSVGVRLGPVFNVSQAMDKVGIQSLTLTQGKNKDALNPFRPWAEGEDVSLRNILEKEYAEFVSVVVAARKNLPKEKLLNEYGAQVYIGKEAEQLGYVDVGNSDYISCLKALAEAAGITEGKEYQVVLISPSHSVLEGLAQSKNGLLKGRIEHVFPIAPGISSDMSGKILFMHTLAD